MHSVALYTILVILTAESLPTMSSLESSQSCPIERSCQESDNPFLPCPVGFICSNSVCSKLDNGKKLNTILKYSNTTYTLASRILDCYCMTYDDTNVSLTIGACSYNCNPGQPMYVSLGLNYSTLNELMCTCGDHYRDGTMCRDCKANYYPTLYTYDSICKICHTGYWSKVRHALKYMAIAYLPLLILTLVVFLLKFNMASSHIQGFLLFSQIISIPAVIRVLIDKKTSDDVHDIIKVFSVILGLSNLDFFRAYTGFICMPNINVFEILILDYITAGLPLLFIGISFVVMKLYERNYRVVVYAWYPFQLLLLRFKQNWDVRSTIADAYCTFFLLSFMKFLSVSFDFIIPTTVYVVDNRGNITTDLRLYYDASREYFGHEHRPFAAIAIMVLIFFILCPVLILFFYQWSWFQKSLSCLPSIFHETVRKFQECYEDGKQKRSRDHRWFSAMFLLLRIIVFVSFASTPTYLYFVLSAIYILMFSLIMLLVQPFKEECSHYLSVNLFFTTLLCLVYISLAGLKIATVKSKRHVHSCYYLAAFFTSISLFYIFGYTVYWLYSRSRLKNKWKTTMKIFTRQKSYGTTDQEEIEGSFPDRIQNPYAYENMGSVVAHERPKTVKKTN